MTVKQIKDAIINDSLDTVEGAKSVVDKADLDLKAAIEKSRELLEKDWGNKSFKTFLEVAIKMTLVFSILSSVVSIVMGKAIQLLPIGVFIALMVTQFIYTVVGYSKYIDKIEKNNKDKEECYFAWFLAYETYTKIRYKEILDILLKYNTTKTFSKEDFEFLKQTAIQEY